MVGHGDASGFRKSSTGGSIELYSGSCNSQFPGKSKPPPAFWENQTNAKKRQAGLLASPPLCLFLESLRIEISGDGFGQVSVWVVVFHCPNVAPAQAILFDVIHLALYRLSIVVAEGGAGGCVEHTSRAASGVVAGRKPVIQ